MISPTPPTPTPQQTPTLVRPRFNPSTLVLTLALVAVAAMAFVRPGAAGASASYRASPTAVASINLERLIFELDEYKALAKSAADEVDRRQKQIDALAEEVKDLDADLKKLDPATQAYATMKRDRDMKHASLETRFTWLMRWQSEDDAILLTKVYEKALLAIDEVAKRDGWDLVINASGQNPVPRELNLRPEQTRAFVLEWIQSRRVLFAGEASDITSTVAKHMNNKYAAGR